MSIYRYTHSAHKGSMQLKESKVERVYLAASTAFYLPAKMLMVGWTISIARGNFDWQKDHDADKSGSLPVW